LGCPWMLQKPLQSIATKRHPITIVFKLKSFPNITKKTFAFWKTFLLSKAFLNNFASICNGNYDTRYICRIQWISNFHALQIIVSITDGIFRSQFSSPQKCVCSKNPHKIFLNIINKEYFKEVPFQYVFA
jgi:hypothetical protein